MHQLRSILLRILNSLRPTRVETELRDQLDVHREMIKADLVSHGMIPADADSAATRAMGNDLLVREFARDELIYRWLDGILRDLRYAARGLFRAPAFAAAVVLTLALGIGANTAIFSVVDRVLLRPLSFPNADHVMLLNETSSTSLNMDVNPANWLDWQRDSKTFESFAAWTNRNPSTVNGEGETERLETESVSHEFFSVLGVRPLLGRDFAPEDDRPGLPLKAIVSYGLWQRKFAGDPSVIGKFVQLNSRPVEIIGVMPAGFQFLSRDTQIWRLMGIDRTMAWRERGGRFLPYVVGRVRANADPAAAKIELENIAARLAQSYTFNKNTSVAVVPVREVMTGQVRTSLWVLFAAVGALLLIACSNVANLLIARSANRRREVAIRTSLGAGWATVVRQLLIESLLLAFLGGIAGLLVARWVLMVLLKLAPAGLLPLSGVGIDQSILLYAAALSTLTGLIVGFAPALPSLRFAVADQLRSGGRSVTASMRLREGLIIVQVGMTVVLLCGAGLLVRSLLKLTGDPVGVDPNNVLTMRVELPGARYEANRQVQFFQRVVQSLRNLPDVNAVSAAGDLPVSQVRIAGTSFRVLGQEELAEFHDQTARVRVIMPGYFKTLGIPLLQGREFHEEDMREHAPQVFVVNQAFVKKFFPAADPLSISLSVFMHRTNPANPKYGEPDNPYGRIIGVTGDVKEGTLRDAAVPVVFYNERQLTYNGLTLFVRSSRGAGLAKEAGQMVRDMDRNLPLIEVRMLSDAFAQSIARDRLNAVVSAAFAICALLLASVGLYGLLAFTVAERTSEIGIRMALGAQASQVLGMVMSQGLRLVLLGCAAGLIAAFAASRVLQSLLFGIPSHDPVTFAAVPGLLGLVTWIAVWIPARRATLVDPIAALREE